MKEITCTPRENDPFYHFDSAIRMSVADQTDTAGCKWRELSSSLRDEGNPGQPLEKKVGNAQLGQTAVPALRSHPATLRLPCAVVTARLPG
jgi:hypothetical protein